MSNHAMNAICDECETVKHCLSSGCVPLVTKDGGERIDYSKPEPFSADAEIRELLRGALLAVVAVIACAAIGWFGAGNWAQVVNLLSV